MAILISYRNEDSPMLSNQLHTALAQRMGARNFIFGVNNVIEPGDIVADAIKQGVQNCDLLMVFIGQNWASSGWSKNNNDPDVMAITIAQSSGKRIIPVYLMDGFQLDKNSLAPSVASLLDRAPFVCKSEDDVVKLTQTLQKFLNPNTAVVSSPSSGSSSSIKPVGFDAPVEAKPMFGVQSAAKVDEFNIEQNAVVAEVVAPSGYQDLFYMPFDGAGIRTRVPNGSHVVVLARDEIAPWLNVVYISTTGQPIAGWIPIASTRNVSYLGMPVEVLDLPISQYEYNSFEEIKALKKDIDKKRNRIIWLKYGIQYTVIFILITAVIGAIIGVANTEWVENRVYSGRSSQPTITYYDTGERLVAGAIYGGILGAMFWYMFGLYAISALIFSQPYKNLSQIVARLKRIMQSKKGTGTLGLETLAKVAMAATGVAGVIGAGALAMKGRERQHQQNLANKGAYGRIDINKR